MRKPIPYLNKDFFKQNKLPLIISAFGLLIFILVAEIFPFKNNLFSLLYPKIGIKALATDFYGKQINTLRIFGRQDFAQAARNAVTNRGVYHAAGIAVDKSSTPNKVYLVDTGNSRVLGFNGIGYCSGSTNLPTPTPSSASIPTVSVKMASGYCINTNYSDSGHSITFSWIQPSDTGGYAQIQVSKDPNFSYFNYGDLGELTPGVTYTMFGDQIINKVNTTASLVYQSGITYYVRFFTGGGNPQGGQATPFVIPTCGVTLTPTLTPSSGGLTPTPYSGAPIPCTLDSDCGSGSSCVIDGSKGADIVIGQPDFSRAACNKDSNLGIYSSAFPDSLCLMGYPFTANIAETQQKTNIDVDALGNLYIPDVWNNRILKYNQPFSNDKTSGKGDSLPDLVIGQPTYQGTFSNQGSSRWSTPPSPTDSSLWIDFWPSFAATSRGVSVDKDGNVWVGDLFNHRVLRFPKDSTRADLVIGQASFNTNTMDNHCFNPSYTTPTSVPLNTLCLPTLAKVDPATGKLYILDEYAGPWVGRILIYNPPFYSGMSASTAIAPTVGPPISEAGGKYVFQASGFNFNPYKVGEYASGVLWANEFRSSRVSLLSDTGSLIKVINAPSNTSIGGHDIYYSACNPNPSQPYSVYTGFHLGFPSGSIGIDQANNLYFADELSHRASRYSLPYNTSIINGTVCLPEPNGGLFQDSLPNVLSNQGLGESFGMVVYQSGATSQLIVKDEGSRGNRLKVWNGFQNKPQFNDTADLTVEANLPVYNHLAEAIDESGHLWLYNGNPSSSGNLRIYQLPFKGNDQPILDNIKLYWADTGGQITNFTGDAGIAFDKINRRLYLVDNQNHRVFRIKDYHVLFDTNTTNDKLLVDMVIGQPDKNTLMCNHNQASGWTAPGAPTADSLCQPNQIKFDKLGNLYIVENAYEGHGNIRISVFMASDLNSATTLFPNLQAQKVFIAPTLTSPAAYNTGWLDKPFSPVTIAFDSGNRMIIANDGTYQDPEKRHLRQLWYYADPLNKQVPDAVIEVPIGVPAEMAFDQNDNLLIEDGTWGRVWQINLATDHAWLVSLSGQPIPYPSPVTSPTITPTNTPVPVTATPTSVPTPITSPIQINTPTPTPIGGTDLTAPTVKINRPKDNATVKAGSSVNIGTNITDNVGVKSAIFYINNNLLCTQYGPLSGSTSCSWYVPSPAGLSYTIKVTAVDAAGNLGSSSIRVTSK